jgi:beta-galactosidase/beta-glucuronidase
MPVQNRTGRDDHAYMECRIRDIHLQGDLNENDGLKSGTLQGQVQLSCIPETGVRLVVEIRVAGGDPMKAQLLRRVFAVTDSVLSFSLPVTGVRRWSAETPVLYEVQLHLTDSGGRGAEVITQQVGFRKIRMEQGVLLVNDRRVRVNGISLPPAVSGQPHESMLQEVRLMKQYNINAVRVQGAVDPYLDMLFDQYGLYVVTDSCCGWQWGDVFSPEGRPLAAAGEMKQLYQSIITTLAAGPKGAPGVGIRVSNDHFFRDLSNVVLEWQVLVNGVPGQRGTVPLLTIGAQQSGVIRLPVKMPVVPGEVLLNITHRLKKAEGLLPSGHVTAVGQLQLRADNTNDILVHPAGELSFTDEGGAFTIAAAATGLNIQFNKQSGWLQHFVVGGRSLLEDSSGLSTSLWKEGVTEPKLQLFSTSTATDIVVVRADYLLPETFCALHVHYTVNARGEIQVEQVLEVDSAQLGSAGASFSPPMLPGFGMQWSLPAGYDSIAYYGRGPQENNMQRPNGTLAGIYRQVVDQPSGGRAGIRWWKITDRQGHGMQVTADSTLLSISASHYTDNVPRARTSVHIDLRQNAPYGNYHYMYKVTPL